MRVAMAAAPWRMEWGALVVVVVGRALGVANRLEKTCYHPAVENWKPPHGRWSRSRSIDSVGNDETDWLTSKELTDRLNVGDATCSVSHRQQRHFGCFFFEEFERRPESEDDIHTL